MGPPTIYAASAMLLYQAALSFRQSSESDIPGTCESDVIGDWQTFLHLPVLLGPPPRNRGGHVSSPGTEPYDLPFTGKVTIRTITDAWQHLSAALAENEAVKIDCSGIDEIDLSCVQLLLAAYRSVGARLSLAEPFPDVLHQTLRRGGFVGDSVCSHPLWLPREERL
jgi:ABC-type transporter Mla MlaB component